MSERHAVASLLLIAALAWLLPWTVRVAKESREPRASVVWSRETAGRNGSAELVWAPAIEVPEAAERNGHHVDRQGRTVGRIGGWRGLLLGHRLDINRATAEDLCALPGVGPGTAEAVLDHRRRNGPFPSVEALQRVRGIGPKTLQRLRPLITVDSPATAPYASPR